MEGNSIFTFEKFIIMKKFLLALSLPLLFASCSQQPNEKGEYIIKPNGQSKEIRIKYKENGGIEYIKQYTDDKPDGLYLSFHDNQNPDNMTFIKDGKNSGTGLVFHKNGILNNFGRYIDGEKTGWFYVFNREGLLTGKREYVIVDGKSYMNQWVEYEPDGSADRINSSYLSLKAKKDTIKSGEEFQMNVTLEASYFKQYMLMIVGPFDEKYTLPKNAACDTIKSTNYTALYKTKIYKNGKNSVRGMVQEIKLSDKEDAYNVRKIYFTKEFFVSR